MESLRLHFQVTGHKQPISAVSSCLDVLATAEQGSIRLWSFGNSHTASGGPHLLRTIACPRQAIRALIVLFGGIHVVGVFEDGVLLYDVGRGFAEERHVLPCQGQKKGASILTASWNADTCSLAMATTAGGVRIYDLLPTPQGPNASVVTRSDSLCARGTARRTVPARLILRHEILMKNVSTTPEGTARVACRQVDLLCSDDSSASGHAGAGILVGIADGHHLCLWDLTTGCTLFTASAVAPEGCKIEKMAWHGAAALLALLCSEGGSSTTLAVHQIDVVAHKMIALFSYTSDVPLAGVYFSAGVSFEDPPVTSLAVCNSHSAPSSPMSSSHRRKRVYLHVVDRVRTLRTWALHPRGATAVAAYCLPAASLRVPVSPSSEAASGVLRTSHGGVSSAPNGWSRRGESGEAEEQREEHNTSRGETCVSNGEQEEWRQDGRHDRRQGRQKRADEVSSIGGDIRDKVRKTGDGQEYDDIQDPEETVDVRTLPTGALAAVMLPSQFRGSAGSGILVVAGVTISGVNFLPEGDCVAQGAEEHFFLSTSATDSRDSNAGHHDEGSSSTRDAQDESLAMGRSQRVLGLEGVVPGNGAHQALIVIWEKQPMFHVLDVGHTGGATVIQQIPLSRRHREDQLTSAPRTDRPCYLTAWNHSTTLETLLCGWNDGAVDVISPQSSRRRSRLLPPGTAYVSVTALGVIPLSLFFPYTENLFLSDLVGYLQDDYGGGGDRRRKLGGVVTLVGNADGTIALWPSELAARPWSVILAHTDAVKIIRTALDAPGDARGPATAARGEENYPGKSGVGGCDHEERDGEANKLEPHTPGKSCFFVVTAGANREVKVWGIDPVRTRHTPSLALRGYTLVGGGTSSTSGGEGTRLTSLELLSEHFMIVGFSTGAVEVWAVPLSSCGGILATTRSPVQVFPLAHTAEVTSIAVSIGLGAGVRTCGASAGRVVFTSSLDCTVVRWVSMAPGNCVKPMARYCLSGAPAATVLLPPPLIMPPGRMEIVHHHRYQPPDTTSRAHENIHTSETDRFRVATANIHTSETDRFRVATAIGADIIILEQATGADLMGQGHEEGTIRRALANALPGTPLHPRLRRETAVRGTRNEVRKPQRVSSWQVGGPNARGVGRYDVLNGIQILPLEWWTSGLRRVAAAASSRKSWRTRVTMDKEGAHQSLPGATRALSVPLRGQCVAQHKREDQSLPYAGDMRQPGRHYVTGHNVGGSATNNCPSKPSVTILTVSPNKTNECGINNDVARAQDLERCTIDVQNMYRTVRGGKTIKMDPGFATAVWHRPLQLSNRGGGDSASRESSSHQDRALDVPFENPSYSVQMTMPSYRAGGKSIDNVSGTRGSADGESFVDLCSETGAAMTPITAGDELHSAGSAVLGWPFSHPPPSYADSHVCDASEVSSQQDYQEQLRGQYVSRTAQSDIETKANLSKAYRSTSPTHNSASAKSMTRILELQPLISVPTMSVGGADLNSSAQGQWLEKLKQLEAVEAEEVILSSQAEMGPATPTATPAKKSILAARSAFNARESWAKRGRVKEPFVVDRTDTLKRGPRKKYNFDSAQAPSSGMLGVGVAVPNGYADARFEASKRSFTPSASLGKTARRRINSRKDGGKSTGNQVDSSSSGVLGAEEAVTEESGVEAEHIVEAFPTGLVISKHFRQGSTGREIFMLDIDKVAVHRHVTNRVRDAQERASSNVGLAKGRVGTGNDGQLQTAADTATPAEDEALSPRARSLREVFDSLSAGRDVLAHEALVKWDYVAVAIERGLVSQYQVKALFRQAHGGRHRGKMVWQDMAAFYDGMEIALDKACAPPLAEEFGVDSERWNSIMVSVYLTRRGDVYVVAMEADNGDEAAPTPLTVRCGGNYGDGSCAGENTRVIAAWATAAVSNPDVPARLALVGLIPEVDYELYAYAESGNGRRSDASKGIKGVGSSGSTIDLATMFSVDPAPSGMSAELVAATRLTATTEREPDENLDIPWEDLPETEKIAEALAALSDPAVARAARAAALDPPTADDLSKSDLDPVSRNKWRSFCRWWAGGGGERTERETFLLRECIFAAQQAEILEEAAMMGVQLLEGDWNGAGAAEASCGASPPASQTNPSARQRRWTAFRSWYRGGRVFDRAHDTLIVAAMLRRPPSPGSQGRPLTPHVSPADRPQLYAPTAAGAPPDEGFVSDTLSVPSEYHGGEIRLEAVQQTATTVVTAAAQPAAAGRTMPATPSEEREQSKMTLPAPPPLVRVTRRIIKLETEEIVPAIRDGGDEERCATAEVVDEIVEDSSNGGTRDEGEDYAEITSEVASLSGEGGQGRPASELGTEAMRLDGIAGWEVEKGEHGVQVRDKENGALLSDDVPPLSRKGGVSAAKRLRMEARQKFLATRTCTSNEAASKVSRLLDVKRQDMKAKRVEAASSGVVARRNRAIGAKKKRRRSQVERLLALKKADELLEQSGKAEDFRQRRGSLGMMRPEDVAAIGVFDSFEVGQYDPEEPDPDLFRRRSSASGEADSMDDLEREAAIWLPRSPEELTLELQLACVHPTVCAMAAAAMIGVPDPEDASSSLSHRKKRWAKFSAWYFSREHAVILPHRKTLLEGETSAAMVDDIIRRGMKAEGLLDPGQDCDLSDFLSWYCEDEALPRQEFRQRRVEQLLQSRRFIATQALAYIPVPFLFREFPRMMDPPPPPMVSRTRLFPSRSAELFSWAEVSRWYSKKLLDDEDNALRASECAGQRAALLDAAQAEEGAHQALERRMARWEEFRSELMRVAARGLINNPFLVGQGEWQYSATLESWKGLNFLGFDTGSGLENKDEVHDALAVARHEANEERERVAEVRRQREIAKRQKLENERRRRAEKERLRWMRETEERRRLVQQHMGNLKRERALEAERAGMEQEDALAVALAREEKRLMRVKQALEAAMMEESRAREKAAAVAAMTTATAKRRQDEETEAMALEDVYSRGREEKNRTVEAVRAEREAYLRELYTPFRRIWGGKHNVEPEENEEGGQHTYIRGTHNGRDDTCDDEDREGRPTMWWKGVDAQQIWRGPKPPPSNLAKPRPGPRFVTHAQGLLDCLEPQAMSMERLSREYLALLGLPYDSTRKMYEKEATCAAKDEDAMVDRIELDRLFTVFEKDEVCNHVSPVVPLQRSGMRRYTASDAKCCPSTHLQPRRGTVVTAESLSQARSYCSMQSEAITSQGVGRETENRLSNRGGIQTTAPPVPHDRRGSGRTIEWTRSGSRPDQQCGRQVVHIGAEEIAGLPLLGDDRDVRTIRRVAEANELHNRDTGHRKLPCKADNGRQQLARICAGEKTAGSRSERIMSPSVPGVTVLRSSETTSPQRHQQWGGFGPGHVPRFFRGKFGVTGAKKRLTRTTDHGFGGCDSDRIALEKSAKNGEASAQKAVDTFVAADFNRNLGVSGGVESVDGGGDSLVSRQTIGVQSSLFSPPRH